MKEFVTNNQTETITLANKILEKLPSDINTIILIGDLSAGKTTFTKGVGDFFGVKKIINSPTFTILKTYEGTKNLHHFDLYRLDQDSETLEYEELIFDQDSFSVIEWPFNAPIMLPKKYLQVKLLITDENRRKIIVEAINFADDWLALI